MSKREAPPLPSGAETPDPEPQLSEEHAAADLTPDDFYFEGPYMVFTAAYHLRRGYCCNSICRHCPYR